jgi:uncharacterized protein
MRKKVWQLILRAGPTLLLLLPAMNAGAASFDCAKAKMKVGMINYSNKVLSKLEEDLTKACSEVLTKSQGRLALASMSDVVKAFFTADISQETGQKHA